MHALTKLLFIPLLASVLAACAVKTPAHKLPPIDPRELPRALGCASDQVAFCAGTDCRPEDYYCVRRDQVLGAIWPGAGR